MLIGVPTPRRLSFSNSLSVSEMDPQSEITQNGQSMLNQQTSEIDVDGSITDCNHKCSVSNEITVHRQDACGVTTIEKVISVQDDNRVDSMHTDQEIPTDLECPAVDIKEEAPKPLRKRKPADDSPPKPVKRKRNKKKKKETFFDDEAQIIGRQLQAKYGPKKRDDAKIAESRACFLSQDQSGKYCLHVPTFVSQRVTRKAKIGQAETLLRCPRTNGSTCPSMGTKCCLCNRRDTTSGLYDNLYGPYVAPKSIIPLIAPGNICEHNKIWFHEMCVGGTKRLRIERRRLRGLEKALLKASECQCELCGEKMASIDCTACGRMFHFPCALQDRGEFLERNMYFSCRKCLDSNNQ